MWDQDLEDASRRKYAWLVGAVIAAAVAAGGHDNVTAVVLDVSP